MKKSAANRVRRAALRLMILKTTVKWWGGATREERLAVLADVRAFWPRNTKGAAAECNTYCCAEDYLCWGLNIYARAALVAS